MAVIPNKAKDTKSVCRKIAIQVGALGLVLELFVISILVFRLLRKHLFVIVVMKGQLAERVFSLVVKSQLIWICPFCVFKSPKKQTRFFPGYLP